MGGSHGGDPAILWFLNRALLCAWWRSKPPSYRWAGRGSNKQPLALEAKAALAAMTLGKRVRLSLGGLQTDRYGRALAHLHVDGDLWVQGEMVRLGLARVYSFQDNRTMVEDLLEIKIQARTAKRGIWALAFYGIR